MNRIVFLLTIIFIAQNAVILGQQSPNRYEVEILANPNPSKKDTRQINSVIVFEKGSVKIVSRRKNQIFKEFKYSDIKSVEHSFSKKPLISDDTTAAILTIFTGLPIFLVDNEKHWLSIVSDNEFAILKLENDNFRMIKAEFEMRKFEVKVINEEKGKKDN